MTLMILPPNLPKTTVIGASGFLGACFFSAYRELYPDSIGTAKIGGNGLFSLDLCRPNVTKLGLKRTGHKEALLLAAVSKIDQCETEVEFTKKINVYGTLELIEQLVKERIKPIYFSSDYVFDGKRGKYSEDDPVNPIVEYGRQKAEIEKEIIGISKGNYLIIRLSKVFSLVKGDKSLLDEMASILAAGGVVKAAFDQVFCPTLISNVISAVSYLQSKGTIGIVNVCSPEIWSRYDLALALANSMGVDERRVEKISLSELNQSFSRPKNTSMIAKRVSVETTMMFTSMSTCLAQIAKNYRKDRNV